jgi:hypothetical protein
LALQESEVLLASLVWRAKKARLGAQGLPVLRWARPAAQGQRVLPVPREFREILDCPALRAPRALPLVKLEALEAPVPQEKLGSQGLLDLWERLDRLVPRMEPLGQQAKLGLQDQLGLREKLARLGLLTEPLG